MKNLQTQVETTKKGGGGGGGGGGERGRERERFKDRNGVDVGKRL